MAASTEQKKCAGCGASLSAAARYCLACYRPVAAGNPVRRHTEAASQINTTQRLDPTVTLLPPDPAQIMRQTRRRWRYLILGVIGLILLIFAPTGLHQWRQQRAEQKQAINREAAARRELSLLAVAMERFKADIGRYPTSAEGLKSLTRRPVSWDPVEQVRLNRWAGPYLDRVIEVDPWGNDYAYETTEQAQSFKLSALDPEKARGQDIRASVASTP